MTPKDLFEILVREHADMLVSYLRCLVRDSALADDIFQETMLVAWRNLDRFDRSRPFGPWLRGIAAKLVMAQRRKNRRVRLVADEGVLEHLGSRFDELHRCAGDTLDEKLDSLRECLDTLPAIYRDAVDLRYRENMKGESLAQRLEISVESSKKRLQRGRDRLLACLERKLAAVGERG